MGAFIPASGQCEEVLPISYAEVVELLGVAEGDVCFCPYAGGGTMFMSRSSQIKAAVTEFNSGATGIMKETLPQAKMAIFGPVVTIPEELPWESEAAE